MQWVNVRFLSVRRRKARDERGLPATFCFNYSNGSLDDMSIPWIGDM